MRLLQLPILFALGVQAATTNLVIDSFNADSVGLAKGTAVSILPSNGGFIRANSSSVSNSAFGLLTADSPQGVSSSVVVKGLFELSDWTGITGSSALTADRYYFLSATPGKLNLTSSGISQIVGVAFSTTKFLVNPELINSNLLSSLVYATNNDTVVSNGLYALIDKRVLTNESRNLVFSSTTNRLGVNVNADFFWGNGAGLTGLPNPTNQADVVSNALVTYVNTFFNRSNRLAPTTFTFPSSTVNWTNTNSFAIEVYIDCTGVTGSSVTKNGQQIFSGLTADMTIGLQPGETFSVSYSLGSPTGRFSPYP